ncbi:MAG: UDP-N-acetylglucosamine 2-epimerase (non-hydrolyzing) [Leptospirales bacterium]|nr:UDP-N-acetylglucosamine 2-epimerase (non-hydrolyzing) [Leptospirales bacterium]
MMLRITTIVGARPQFVKAAVISRVIREPFRDRVSEFLIHTGQHYDENMSDVFFRDMEIPQPDLNLQIGSGSHGETTGKMLIGIEAALLANRPDLLLVYGDTNSTLAGALAASKLHIPVAHVEAGLRSFNRQMPEEQNRIVTDHLSRVLLCPTSAAVKNLAREGVVEGENGYRVFRTGDVMLDASLFYRERVANRSGGIVSTLGLSGDFFLLTMHRAENTDDPRRLRAIWEGVSSSEIPGVFPVHPRTRKVIEQIGLRPAKNITLIDPVGYHDMIELESSCRFIVTDSGGVQKEAYFFGKPCITLRDQTEWVETVEAGWNVLAGADSTTISQAMKRPIAPKEQPPLYGDGNSGREIVQAILTAL